MCSSPSSFIATRTSFVPSFIFKKSARRYGELRRVGLTKPAGLVEQTMRRSRVFALASGGWFGLIQRVDWSAVFAFLIGLLSGFLSITAGAAVTVVIPVLLALGLSADAANATSRFSLALAGLLAAVAFVRQHTVDWKATVPLLLAAAAGTVAGSFVGVRIPSPDMLTIIVITSARFAGAGFSAAGPVAGGDTAESR